nr:retrovirus-related Pol polyprotein from transposon TNT 1-94 [Tanacetum cinerariifolium]
MCAIRSQQEAQCVVIDPSVQFKVESCHERRDGFSEEEQDLKVSRSFSWAKAGELQMVVQEKKKGLKVFKSLGTRQGWWLVDSHRGGIDYNEVFSPVVRHTSIRIILALTACKDYKLEQLNVKTALLHRNLEEVIYMRQPPGYEQVIRSSLEVVGCSILQVASRALVHEFSGYLGLIKKVFLGDSVGLERAYSCFSLGYRIQ